MKSERQNLKRRQANKVEALVARFAKLTLDLVFLLNCLGTGGGSHLCGVRWRSETPGKAVL